MRWYWLVLIGAGAILGSVSLLNASWPKETYGVGVKLIAHRGLHQAHHQEGLMPGDCTARRMLPPRHEFIENTIPAIHEAFRLGADMVEIDVQITADNEFVVFQDASLECRTQIRGAVSNYTLAQLKRLDVGHGYTADGGRTFPFRGKGEKLMPSLAEVLKHFGNKRFLINMGGTTTREAEALSFYLARHAIANPQRLWIYGRGPAVALMRALRPEIRVFDMDNIGACSREYIFTGWTGVVPEDCRDNVMFVSLNATRFMWGWPNKFQDRMKEAGIEPVLLATNAKDADGPAFNTREEFKRIPASYTGWVWTDHIEIIGPAARWR